MKNTWLMSVKQRKHPNKKFNVMNSKNKKWKWYHKVLIRLVAGNGIDTRKRIGKACAARISPHCEWPVISNRARSVIRFTDHHTLEDNTLAANHDNTIHPQSAPRAYVPNPLQ